MVDGFLGSRSSVLMPLPLLAMAMVLPPLVVPLVPLTSLVPQHPLVFLHPLVLPLRV
jgi:hypothetical protein